MSSRSETASEGAGIVGLVAAVATALGAVSALGVAVWAGLGRMGALNSTPPAWLLAAHGPLVVNGFFGAVISLERAVALDRVVAFAVPVAATWGAWLAVAGGSVAGRGVVLAASVGLVALFAVVTVRAPEIHHVVMGVGALAWAAGAGVWFVEGLSDWAAPTKAPLWAAFLILTIAGERLELARVLQIEGWRRGALVGALGTSLVGALVALAAPSVGIRLFGVGVVATAVWLGVFDVARRTARQSGLTGYIGRVLLVGYAWLAVGGGLLVWVGGVTAGPAFGAAWHAILLGFVFGMIFAHAPVVIRALAGRRVRFHPALYVAPVVLTVTLVVRVVADFGGWSGLRAAGGIGNAAAIGVFAGTVVVLLER